MRRVFGTASARILAAIGCAALWALSGPTRAQQGSPAADAPPAADASPAPSPPALNPPTADASPAPSPAPPGSAVPPAALPVVDPPPPEAASEPLPPAPRAPAAPPPEELPPEEIASDFRPMIGPLAIDIHAFVSQGFILSTENHYLARSKAGSFEFTELAVNFSSAVSDQLRIGLQLMTRKLGSSGSYAPIVDWGYADYRFADWLGIRVGRSKFAFGLYNESVDVDAARVPVLLPYSIYPEDTRALFAAVSGGELYGNIGLGGAGELEYQAYGGTFPFPGGASNRPGVLATEVDVHYLVGGRLMWLPPLPGLQLGASFQALRYDTEFTFDPAFVQVLVMAQLAPADFNGVVELSFPIRLWVASVEYAAGDLLLAAEYGRWNADLKSSQPSIVPSSGPTNERYYVMGSYRLGGWFVPGLLYSGYYVNVDEREGRQNYQHDVAATLRFDLTPNWLLKLEAHWMLGTAALEPYRQLNDDKELADLARSWSLFLVKTTAYF